MVIDSNIKFLLTTESQILTGFGRAYKMLVNDIPFAKFTKVFPSEFCAIWYSAPIFSWMASNCTIVAILPMDYYGTNVYDKALGDC